MANKTPKQQPIKEKRKNPVLRIMLGIFLLFFIAIAIFFGYLYFTDFSVSQWARESDNFIANLIDSEKADSSIEITESEEGSANNVNQADQLAEKDEEIDYLMSVIEELEFTVMELEQEVLRLENNLENEGVAEETINEPTSGASQVKKLAQSYEEMDSDRAAAIFAAMDDAEAVLILRDISPDIRGEILQEMEAEHAARLSLLLIEE